MKLFNYDHEYSLDIPRSRGFKHHMIAFSGGRSSAYLLMQMLDKNPDLADNCHVLFQNTGRESRKTLEFIRKIADKYFPSIKCLQFKCNRDGYESFDRPPVAQSRRL